jgi:AcrR family transcriptional regulator
MTMSRIPDPVKSRRTYDARGRREQATLARERILDIAHRLFLSHGFSSTTIVSIATEARVSPDTIYKSFNGKPGLVRALCERALAGTGPVPAEQRSDEMQASTEDPRNLLRGLGMLATEVAPRVAPLLLLLATAAETDDEIAQLRTDLDNARLARMTTVARTLAAKTQLRPGVSVEIAGEIIWAYSSPELYGLLVAARGWTTERYGDFIGEALIAALLGPEQSGEAVASNQADP